MELSPILSAGADGCHKQHFVFSKVLASPPWGTSYPSAASGRRERGFPVLHYNPAMPVKNPSTQLRAGIIPGQRVTKEKLERARELRRDMTPAEKILWQELRGNKLGVHFRRHTCPGGRCQGQVIAGLRR